MSLPTASDTRGKQLAHAGVEQERLVAAEQELVEREARRRGHFVDVSREPEDVGGDLVVVDIMRVLPFGLSSTRVDADTDADVDPGGTTQIASDEDVRRHKLNPAGIG